MKGFGGMREMEINHGLTRTGFANARLDSKTAERKRGVSVLVCGLFNHGLHRLAALTLAIFGMAWAVNAATGTSGEFRVDLAGMGPWEMRTARLSEAISYSSAWATNALDGANAVVKVWPVKREKPKYIAIDLSGGTAATHYPIEYLDEIPGGAWSDEYKTSKLVLRHIPAGSFIMGGRATDYPGAVNTNLHMVTLTKDFYMGVFEVTQRQWELVMGNRPSMITNEQCYATRPVERIGYTDIRGSRKGIMWPQNMEVDELSFIGRLREKVGLIGLDLPTEAQWEYACRAGSTTGLNNGLNVTSFTNDSALARLARFGGNSGSQDIGGYYWGKETDALVISEFANAPESRASAPVGSYLPNGLGLYDTHGNVAEWCLDRWATFLCGSIDPIGALTGTNRVIRSGTWDHVAAWCVSSWRLSRLEDGGKARTTGFRLCLQGGELPEMDAGRVLVNEAGEGTAEWRPTKVGTYYLTHETQTNGVNGAEVQGAWFEVVGPELKFTLDGDLVPGVKVAIDVAVNERTVQPFAETWVVYYTLDGTMPSPTAGIEYTGPITLNETATLRAMAYYEKYSISSKEFSETFALLSIGSARAKPRYPWNGKVDVDVEVKGKDEEDYLVSLNALDLDGGTNLPLRTAWQTGGAITNNAFLVKPGQYRFTWDADTDIAGDFDFANVAVSVSAAAGYITGFHAESASNVMDNVHLTWNANDEAMQYEIFRDNVPLATTTSTMYEDEAITYSGEYSYSVRPVFAGGSLGPQSEIQMAHCYRAAVTNGLVVYLPMDGDDNSYGAIPFISGGNPLEWNWGADRIETRGKSFYNTSIDSVMKLSSVSVKNSFTICFWAKTTCTLSKFVEQRTSGNYGVTQANYPYVVFPTKGSDAGGSEAGLGVAVGINGVIVAEHAGDYFPATLVCQKTIGDGWNHYVVTMHNNGAPTLYVNGNKIKVGGASSMVKKIANSPIGGDRYGVFIGYIDDFLLYDRALTDDEIRAVYQWNNGR